MVELSSAIFSMLIWGTWSCSLQWCLESLLAYNGMMTVQNDNAHSAVNYYTSMSSNKLIEYNEWNIYNPNTFLIKRKRLCHSCNKIIRICSGVSKITTCLWLYMNMCLYKKCRTGYFCDCLVKNNWLICCCASFTGSSTSLRASYATQKPHTRTQQSSSLVQSLDHKP